jgi:hypothetical protein
MLRPIVCLAVLAMAAAPAGAGGVSVQDVPSAASVDPARLKPGVLAFSDGSDATGGTGGLTRFEDWARIKPVQKELLSLYPTYAEPTITVTVNGLSKPYVEKLQVYVAEARFVAARPPESVDLARYATLDFLAGVDPAIKHRAIGAADAEPHKDPALAYNRRPGRPWCEAPQSVCVESRYALEGKLPVGIRLANKLEEGGKPIADYISFQSELRVVPPEEAAALGRLTGLSTPVVAALEESLFHVNQMMQFGKVLAVLQGDPGDPKRSVVTAFVALGIETDVLERKREFERVPVLRNLVPIQVLMGRSSFNTGSSLSAGLPAYSRNRLKALAELLQ